MRLRMPHRTLIFLLLALARAMTKEDEMGDEEGDIVASVRDILYEDVASNEIDTDVPAIKR